MEFNFPKGGVFIILILIGVFILFSKSTVTIGPGEGGVIFETLGNGINTDCGVNGSNLSLGMQKVTILLRGIFKKCKIIIKFKKKKTSL